MRYRVPLLWIGGNEGVVNIERWLHKRPADFLMPVHDGLQRPFLVWDGLERQLAVRLLGNVRNSLKVCWKPPA